MGRIAVKRGFSLMELMVAVLLGAIIMLVIAGGLSGAIKSWAAVQERVGENYNRRSVLDLIKRQTSSLFFKSDAETIAQVSAVQPQVIDERQQRIRRPRRRSRSQRMAAARAALFQLPPGTHFFKGSLQEVSFLSTISFLSDFPGQVAVRYYVIQGEPGEELPLGEVPNSRSEALPLSQTDAELDPEEFPDELQGNLYLVMEEKNLFLSSTRSAGDGGALSDETVLDPDNGFEDDDEEAPDDNGMEGSDRMTGSDLPEDSTSLSEVVATNSMVLLGPLRKFTVRYRQPAIRLVDEADEEEDWALSWNLDFDNMYPSAVEFILVYEPGGLDEDTPTESLPGIRMVIPIYDSRNLVRGGANGLF